jgi:four helix bundle protein
MQDFRRLKVWQAAQSLAARVVIELPEGSTRVPGLRSQAIRSATSVGANIAEGCGRANRNELLQFLDISLASLNELEAHIDLAVRVRVISIRTGRRLATDIVVVRKLLYAFRRSVQHSAALEMDAKRSPSPRTVKA